MSVIRHYFPGNNTPEGFFSYYGYILGQREANRIICIKGGPGTGKSTFLKKVGQKLCDAGESVDFLHCSADGGSLDGIVAAERKIALIDGTSPHIIDPVTPGAVDSIINFGDFWNEKRIAGSKEDIIAFSEETSRWYKIAYHHLAAARNIYDSLSDIQREGIEVSEIYKLAADIIAKEYRGYDISFHSGRVKKFFATGLTFAGNISYIKTLLQNMKHIYLLNVPEGYSNTGFMNILLDGAIYRGFDVEAFYCPMDPQHKIEHLLVPELSLAVITANRWHDLEPWEISGEDGEFREITMVDISDYQSVSFAEKNAEITKRLSDLYGSLLQEAMDALARAKENHDIVEKMYIRCMDFEKIDQLAEKTAAEILG